MSSQSLPVLSSTEYDEGVCESHLYMWRAIIALAHRHDLIDETEQIKLQSYINKIHFSAAQKATVTEDLSTQQDLSAKLAKISRPEDQAHFFEFARIIHWNEGDLIMQEQKIMRDFLEHTIAEYNMSNVKAALQVSEHAPVIQEAQKDASFAERVISISKKILSIFPELDLGEVTNEASESEFYLWRALFALAHADGQVTGDEITFLNNAMATSHLTEKQRIILQDDMENPKNIEDMFEKITIPKHRTQFFYHARLLFWSDGDFDKQEQELMARLQSLQVKTVDLEGMVGQVDLELEDTGPEKVTLKANPEPEKRGFWAWLFRRKN